MQTGKEAQQAMQGREAGLQEYGKKMDEVTEHRRKANLYKAGQRRVSRNAIAIDGLHLFFLANAYRDAARQGASVDQLAQIRSLIAFNVPIEKPPMELHFRNTDSKQKLT